LQVEEYERETPFDRAAWQPSTVRVKLRQHAGLPAIPAVQEGKKVKKGQVVGRVDASKLGVNIHASMDGRVGTVTPDYVEVVA
jgi:Na+-translocating ferredoxin:NAD+ oxidoreductase RnfC subunit